MLIEDGANPKEVMVEMGHSNIAMTYDLYGHLFTDADADTRRAERAERLASKLMAPNPQPHPRLLAVGELDAGSLQRLLNWIERKRIARAVHSPAPPPTHLGASLP